MHPINMKGQKFNRVTVLSYDRLSAGSGHGYWYCKCKCGNIFRARGSHLRDGNIKSCGCYSTEIGTKYLTAYARSAAHKGKGNPMWKGDKAQHSSIHTWLNSHYKKIRCENCKSIKNLDWALLKRKKHRHKRNNYWILCRSCHLKYDYTQARKDKLWKNRKRI